MGTMVNASCDCGYSSRLSLGGGRTTFETNCWFPVYCRACRMLEEANLLAQPITCPSCGASDVVPYDAPELIGTPGGEEVFSWNMTARLGRTLHLTDGRYLCPACQTTQLQFQYAGRWD